MDRRSTASTDPTASNSRGAAMVEFAILLPVLVMLVFGIVEFGRGYHTRTSLTHAAREAVRVAALDSGDPVQTARDAAPNLNPADMTVVIAPSPCIPGNPVTVSITYDHDYDVPLVGTGTWTFVEQGVMRCNG